MTVNLFPANTISPNNAFANKLSSWLRWGMARTSFIICQFEGAHVSLTMPIEYELVKSRAADKVVGIKLRWSKAPSILQFLCLSNWKNICSDILQVFISALQRLHPQAKDFSCLSNAICISLRHLSRRYFTEEKHRLLISCRREHGWKWEGWLCCRQA